MLRNKHPSRIVTSNLGWQKSIKCSIVLKSLIAVMMLGTYPAMASDAPVPMKKPMTINQASPTAVPPCTPPQLQTEKSLKKDLAAVRNQRNAGPPSMSYAVALSMALGLRTALGPVVKSEKVATKTPDSSKTVAKARPVNSTGNYALISDSKTVRCVNRMSMKESYPKLAMER